MRYLLTLLTISLLFSQELEVEGDLKVTGTVQSVTIDSLNQVIADMQGQIDSLHALGGLETRLFNTENYFMPFESSTPIPLDIQSLIGTEIEHAFINVISIQMDGNDYTHISLGNTMTVPYEIEIHRWAEQGDPISIKNNGTIVYTKEVYNNYGNYINLLKFSNEAINISFTLSITAQFPD